MINAALINNRYRILETIGRGGFGETYLAEDMHMPSGRKCVIKQLKPIVEQPAIPLWMKERFQREAAILEALGAASNQIPELYAYFSENEQFYLVQEWIEGETLAQKWQRQGNFTSTEVTQLLSQILPVLGFIHKQKIVHRDIKPENIILRNSDRNSVADSPSLPVLIDFGAVKEAVSTTAHHKNNSAFSAVIGTPGYMSSEQAAGRPLYSSDLYSLGLMAVFLLTGKSPQELEIDAQTGEVVWEQAQVDKSLAAVINKAIRFHPRDRFSQAKEMLAALKTSRNYSQINSQAMTGKTVKVAPAMAAVQNVERDFAGTVAYRNSATVKKAKKGSWLNKVGLFLLVSGGLSVGAIALGFYTVSNWWESWTQPAPQVKVPRQPKSKPVLIPFPKKEIETPEDKDKAANETEDSDKPEKKVLEELKKKLPQKPQSIPEVVIQPKPIPQKPIEVPILTTGTSESQLVSTLGKPTSQRNEPRNNSKILTYRNVTANNVNLTYHSDTNGQIKQADVALSQELSLGSMQETLTKLLRGKSSADAKNKLRDVYNRKSDRYSFRVDNLRGSVYRDAKDRVNISVWE